MEEKDIEVEEDLDLEETEEEEETEPKETPKTEDVKKPAKQSRETNAYFAELRRKEKEAEYKRGLREGIKTNPYTDTPINDDFDLETYQIMKKLDEEGKDPVASYSEYITNMKRKSLTKEKEQAEQEEKAKADVEKFFSDNPTVSRSVLKDEDFLDYAEGKFGHKPLEEIYKGFMRLKGKSVANEKVKEETPKKKMPTSQPSGESEPKSISKMTDKEVEEMFNAKFKTY